MANKDFNFSWKFKNFEIRTVRKDFDNSVSKVEKNCPIEIIKYFDNTHSSYYVIAWWVLNDEGYSLKFVGDRPMKDISPKEMESIWRQICAAQNMLNEYFIACNADDDDEDTWRLP